MQDKVFPHPGRPEAIERSVDVRIHLVGGFRIEAGGKAIDGLSRKAKALVGCLALSEGFRESRERLVGLLWSESGDERARASLRQALYEIREAMATAGFDGLTADKNAITLGPAGVSVDALAMIAEAKAGSIGAAPFAQGDPTVALLRDLDGVDPAFDEWLAARRDNFRATLTTHLQAALRGKGAPDGREAAARALMALDPAHEEAARHLIRSRAAAGDIGAALGLYKALWDRLADEYDVEPSTETQDLVAEIKLAQPFTGQAPAPTPAPPTPSAIAGPPIVPAATQTDFRSPSLASLASSRDGPSLAVLPFVNMSGDPEQEYFADGITEEIITALSRVKWFFVIARNSSFTYKGRAVDVRQIGRELGVRYVLEGSVRKAGNRLRITGQLVEAETGRHVWAERFDGELDDVFALQDKVTEAVAAAIEPSLRAVEIERSRNKTTPTLAAYDYLLRALPGIMFTSTREENDRAISNLRRAIVADRNFAQAKAYLSFTLGVRRAQRWSSLDDDREAVMLAEDAIKAAADDPITLATAGHVLSFMTLRHDEGSRSTERAFFINPNSARVLLSSGWVQYYLGNADVAITRFQRAIRLSPIDAELGYIYSGLSLALFRMGLYDEGALIGRRAVAEAPNWLSSYNGLIINLVGAARLDEARDVMKCLLALAPDSAVSLFRSPSHDEAYTERYRAALRAAGMPE